MNPLDVSATMDQSTMNVSLNMSTIGKKPGSSEGTPLPRMLQPSPSVTVSKSSLSINVVKTPHLGSRHE